MMVCVFLLTFLQMSDAGPGCWGPGASGSGFRGEALTPVRSLCCWRSSASLGGATNTSRLEGRTWHPPRPSLREAAARPEAPAPASPVAGTRPRSAPGGPVQTPQVSRELRLHRESIVVGEEPTQAVWGDAGPLSWDRT